MVTSKKKGICFFLIPSSLRLCVWTKGVPNLYDTKYCTHSKQIAQRDRTPYLYTARLDVFAMFTIIFITFLFTPGAFAGIVYYQYCIDEHFVYGLININSYVNN